MLYYFAEQCKQTVPFFSSVNSVSFRFFGAFLTAFILSLLLGRWFIKRGSLFLCSGSRQYTPKNARISNNPPIMGGLFVIGAAVMTTLIWGSLSDPFVLIMLACLLSFAGIGAWDDWSKIRYGNGISGRAKSVGQCLVAVVLFLFCSGAGFSTTIDIPFFSQVSPDWGNLFIFWFIFVVVGTSNGVNLTDGLDGLAVTSLIPAFLFFSVVAYMASDVTLAHLFALSGTATAEVAIVGVILAGASLGFLWYNAYPAQVIMGDVGALSLGATLGLMALLVKKEWLLVLVGGIFVLETASVIMQLFSYKVWGRRLFKMAPIHHHFELIGVPEAVITVRFGLVSVILCSIAWLILICR